MRNPATIAVNRPCSGRTPLPIASASDNGSAMIATVTTCPQIAEEKLASISFAQTDDAFGQERVGDFPSTRLCRTRR